MKLQHLIITLFISVAFLSCKNENSKNATNNIFKFRKHISYTTSGVVSVAEPIRIDLVNEVDLWEPNEEVSNDFINISPKIDGKLAALNTRSLLFQPSENLEPNKEYTVTVNLGKMYNNIATEFKKYTFKFKTLEQNFSVATTSFQSYSKQWQYIEGIIKTADILELEKAKTLISAVQKDTKLKIKWENLDLISKQFQFKIDSVQRFEDDSEVLLSWSGKSINVTNEGESSLRIPGKNNFSIVNIDVFQLPEQHLNINFSDPLKKQQNFNGLVEIQHAKNLKYVVDGNVLKVYPNTRIVGSVNVDVFQGVKSIDGYKLKNEFSEKVAFEQLKPKVKLLSSGVILPSSNDLKFNFKAVNWSQNRE